MPGGDTGEDFAEWSFQQSQQLLQQWMMRSMMRGGGKSLRLWSRTKELFSSMNDRWGLHFPDRDEAVLNAEGVEAGLVDLDAPEPDVEPAFAYAADIPDAKYLAEQLDQAGLEWTMRKDPSCDLWRFKLDAGELAKATPEFQGYLRYRSAENIQTELAIGGACAQARPEVEALGLPEFTPGSKDNRAFGFRTVQWDPDAQLMRDFLDEAGIPFKADKVSDSLVRFEVQPELAGAVEEIADVMCKSVKGIDPKRFEFQEGFNAIAPEKQIGRATVDPQVAEIVKGELQAQGIEYTASQTGIDGQVEIVANIHDVDALKKAYDNVVQREVAVVPPEQAETMQKMHDARNAGNRMREQKRAQEAQKNTARQISEDAKRRSPSRDQRDMERSARERGTKARTPKRTHNVTKGGK